MTALPCASMGTPTSLDDATLVAPPLEQAASSEDTLMVSDAPSLPPRSPRLTELMRGGLGPTRLGHYVLLDKLGEGGMGVVFSAYDERLDRKVAIKLLRNEGGPDAQQRLVREAQALARLSDLNVVQIYEIGERGELTFIVMEFIEGQTLGAWTRGEPRGRAEIVQVFAAAGRGLAAAHAKGLVHRDFKPDNVMIRADGRVVVMDFGLAREQGEAQGEGSAPRPREIEQTAGMFESSTGQLSQELTRTGALLGTPAYMAPEQFHGRATDAKTDQFSFCIALWEALHGERPFEAENLAGLTLAVTQGELRAPANERVPGWLQRVLERGLQVDPSDRWPSMGALLGALAADPTSRRRWIGAAAAGLALSGGLVASVLLSDARVEAEALAACEAQGQVIEQAWNAKTRELLGQRYTGERAEAWGHARDWMDGYARSWAELKTRSCVESPADDHARLAACLEQGRARAQALVEIWSSGDERMLAYAATAATQLPPVEECDDPARLVHQPELPEDAGTQAAVAGLRAKLELIEALLYFSEQERALVEARETLAGAEAIGWAPLVAEARLALGEVQLDMGEAEAARATLERATLEATRASHDLALLEAASALVRVVGHKLGEHEQGMYWADFGASLLARLSLEGTLHEAALLERRAGLTNLRGEYELSLEHLHAALQIYETRLGDQHPRTAGVVSALAFIHRERGEFDASIQTYEQALTVLEASLGPQHVSVASTLNAMGDALRQRGDLEAALAANERAVATLEAALGPMHPELASSLNILGTSRAVSGDIAGALATYERALRIGEAAFGPNHFSVAAASYNVAMMHVKLGELEGSLEPLYLALERFVAAHGAEHQYVALCRKNIAQVLADLGRHTDALAELERALEGLIASVGAEHVYVAQSYGIRGGLLRELGQLERARADLEHALALFERGSSQVGRNDASFEMARTLDRLGERALALEFAEQARAGYARAGARGAKQVRKVEAWIAER